MCSGGSVRRSSATSTASSTASSSTTSSTSVVVGKSASRWGEDVLHAVVVEAEDAKIRQMNEAAQRGQHVVLQIHAAQVVEGLMRGKENRKIECQFFSQPEREIGDLLKSSALFL